MISGVTKTIDGEAHTFRLTTRAMMAIEDHFEKGLIEVLQGLEKGFRITDLVRLISEAADNGQGVEMNTAQHIVDQLGVTSAGDLLGEVSEAAFPEAKGATAKNAKRASRSK